MKKKITYKIHNETRITFDYATGEDVIDSYRKAYGEHTAKAITIISITNPTAKDIADYNRGQEGMANYFATYGTANE